METIKQYFVERHSNDPRVKSITVIQNDNHSSPLIDGFDMLVLVISENKEPYNHISHYIKEDYRIQERWIHRKGLETWILNGENRNIIQWILRGEILMDRDSYLEGIRRKVSEFPQLLREQKLLMEFSYFLKKFLQSKDYLNEGHYLDAYSHILESLFHWARIVIVEEGYHPEVTVWSQVKKINPGVYKLYEELTFSQETVEKRVQLIILACEFSVMSKMKSCCQVLLRVLENAKKPLSAIELRLHPDLDGIHIELALTLRTLVNRSLIREVAVMTGKDTSILELKYMI